MPIPRPIVVASLWTLLLTRAALAAPTMTWPAADYNPKPAAGDVLLPLPCGGVMAFRVIAVGPAPRPPVNGVDFRTLAGPLPLGAAGAGAFLFGKYEVSARQAAAVRAWADGKPCEAELPADSPALGFDESQRVRKAMRARKQPVAGLTGDQAGQLARDYSAWLVQFARDLPTCTAPAAAHRPPAPCLPRLAGGGPALVRLPTGVEWEYAARGGQAVTVARFAGDRPPLPGDLGAHAWYAGNKPIDPPAPIGGRAPDALGLHDLYGNLAEYQSEQLEDRQGRPAYGTRGGDYLSEGRDLAPGHAPWIPSMYGSEGRSGGTSQAGLRLLIGAPVWVGGAGVVLPAAPVAPAATDRTAPLALRRWAWPLGALLLLLPTLGLAWLLWRWGRARPAAPPKAKVARPDTRPVQPPATAQPRPAPAAVAREGRLTRARQAALAAQLNRLGYTLAEPSGVRLWGLSRPLRQSIRAFQSDQGLAQSGRLDATTVRALAARAAAD